MRYYAGSLLPVPPRTGTMSSGGEDGKRAASVVLRYFVMSYRPQQRLLLGRAMQYMMGWTEEQFVAFWQNEHVALQSSSHKRVQVQRGQSYCVDEQTQLLVTGDCTVDGMGATPGDWQVPAGPGRVQSRYASNADRDTAAFARGIQEYGLGGFMPWLPGGRVTAEQHAVQNFAQTWLIRLLAPYYGVYVHPQIEWYDTRALKRLPFQAHSYMLVPYATKTHAMFLYFDVRRGIYTIHDPNGSRGHKSYHDTLRSIFPSYDLQLPSCPVFGVQNRAQLWYCTVFTAITMILTMASRRAPVEVDALIQATLPTGPQLEAFMLRFNAFLRVLANGNDEHEDPVSMSARPRRDLPGPVSDRITPNYTLDYHEALARYNQGEFWPLYDLGYVTSYGQSDEEDTYRRTRGVQDTIDEAEFMARVASQVNTWGTSQILVTDRTSRDLPTLVGQQLARFLPDVDLNRDISNVPHLSWRTRLSVLDEPQARGDVSEREQEHRASRVSQQETAWWRKRMADKPLRTTRTSRSDDAFGPYIDDVPTTDDPALDGLAESVMIATEDEADTFCELATRLKFYLDTNMSVNVYQEWKKYDAQLYDLMAYVPIESGTLPRLDTLTTVTKTKTAEEVRRLLKSVEHKWWMHPDARRFLTLSRQELNGLRTRWYEVYRHMSGLALNSLLFDAAFMADPSVVATIAAQTSQRRP